MSMDPEGEYVSLWHVVLLLIVVIAMIIIFSQASIVLNRVLVGSL